MDTNIIYQYIVEADPYAAKAICNKYGYSLANATGPADIAACLEDIVGANGQPAFLEILALHPDKDVILEVFGNATVSESTKTPCGCGDTKKKSAIEAYVPTTDSSTTSIQQANVFLIAAALILAVAIISK